MEEDHTSGDEAECEPKDSGPGRAFDVPPLWPAVSSVADQLIGKSWASGPEINIGDYLAGSPAIGSVLDAVTSSPSEAGLAMSKLVGSGFLAQVAPDAALKLTDLGANQADRVWDELRAGPGLDVGLAGEAAPRAKRLITDVGMGLAGLRADSPLGGAVTPVWESAASFLPSGPQPSVLSGFTSGIAEKIGANLGSFAGLDLGSSRFLADHLSNVAPVLPSVQWPWPKWSDASVLEGVTTAMHRHVQGLAGWMETTHRAAMDGLWRAPQESIAKVLQSFSTLADQGMAWGWRALRAALRARRAVLRGDLEAIARFLREWLGFKNTPPTLVDAASAVLLEEAAWLPADVDVDEDVCPRIRKLTIREHRNFRLIGDTELCGRSVDSLDREVMISRSEAVSVPLVEVVPAPPPPAGVDDISDPRLVSIIDRLTERERTILQVRAETRNWPDTAVMSGATRAEVENLRRKVKRLSKAAGVTAPAPARAVS